MMTVPGRRIIFVLATVVLLTALGGGCATMGTAPVASSSDGLQTLTPGWERFFDIDCQAGERKGKPVVNGRIRSTSGLVAERVQLLVEGLDETGRVVNRQVARLGGDVPAFEKTYFEVPVQKSASYRVSVYAYDWVRSGGGM